MDVHIHANCQAIPIAGMLREADPDWRVTWFEVHGPEIIEHFDEHCARVRTADLVISQPIHQGYRDREELSIDWIRDHIRPDATLLVVPSMHFSGHHPGLDGLPLTGLPFLSNLLAAHLVASGCASDDAVRLLLSDNLLSDAEIDTEIQTSLDETTRRETEDHIDIRIGPFLAKHCRTRTLFHIQNHPLRETAAFVANQILARTRATRTCADRGPRLPACNPCSPTAFGRTLPSRPRRRRCRYRNRRGRAVARFSADDTD